MGVEVQPLVTVIVPSYNHRRYILECLDSIKSQTYSNYQWIVVDDGSKDGSQDLLKEKQSYYGYELVIQKNKGVSATLTDIIKNRANGKYIACCASDDSWLPDKLQKQVDYMETHPECAMCFGKTLRMDVNSCPMSDDNDKYYRGGVIFNDIITQKFHPPVNYMYRKSVLENMGYFPQGVIAEDFYMNCKIAYNYTVGYLADYMGCYRVAPTETKRDPFRLLKSHEETIHLYSDDPIYKRAILLQDFRYFYFLSSYIKYKGRSFWNMIKSTSLLSEAYYRKQFCIGLYKLILKWDKC